MKNFPVTPPYSESMIKMAINFEATIDKIKEGKSEEQGIKDVRKYFNNKIKL